MYVCLCKGVTDRTIRAEVARGACSTEEIAACTGAGTKCGSCRAEIGRIVEAELAGAASARRELPVLREVARAADAA
jgi:bacterioferritin-associated ferredoxin